MMNRIGRILAICAIAAITHSVWGDEGDANKVLRMAVDLSDGSHIIGTPSISSVSFQTSYAKMEIPLAKITRIKIAADHENVSVELINGDALQGVLNLGSIKLTTIFGNVAVGTGHVTTISVLSGGMSDNISVWNFDGNTANDAKGRYNGTWHGTETYASGLRGTQAASFNGESYISVDHSFAANYSISYSLWVSISSASMHGEFINDVGIINHLGLGIGVGSGTFDSDGNHLIVPFWGVDWQDTGINLGTGWHHIVVVIGSDGKLTAYLDGGNVFSGTSVMGKSTGSTMLIGRDVIDTGLTRYFTGQIEDIAVWTRVLLPTEVANIYNAGKP